MKTRTINPGRASLWFGLVIGCVAVCVGDVKSRPQASIDIAVAEGRPLAAAILELENRYGWAITYEDPPYESPTDVDDVTLAVSKDPKPKNRVLVPRHRAFSFRYESADQARPFEVLTAMLTDYHLTVANDEFRLTQTGPVFHIVPKMSANAQRIPTVRQSRLDAAITIEDRERGALETMGLILRQVRLVTGTQVVEGTVPLNFLVQRRVRIGATGESARDVLVRTFAATGAKLSWRLLCDPGVTKQCALNVHFVPVPKSEG